MNFTASVEHLSYGFIKPDSSISFSFGRQLGFFKGADPIVFMADISITKKSSMIQKVRDETAIGHCHLRFSMLVQIDSHANKTHYFDTDRYTSSVVTPECAS